MIALADRAKVFAALGVFWFAGCAPAGDRRPTTQPAPSPAHGGPSETTLPTETAPPAVTSVRPRVQSSASGCIAGARTLDTPGVCLKVPEGYEVSAQHATDLTLAHAESPPIRLQWSPASAALLDDLRDGLKRLAEQDPQAIVGDTLDARGVFVFAAQTGGNATAETPEVRRALSVGRSAQGLLVRCTVEAAASDPVTRELFEACQTMSFAAPPT